MAAVTNLVLNVALACSVLSVAVTSLKSIGGWELTHFDTFYVDENSNWKLTLGTDSTNIRIKFKIVSQTPEVPEFTLDENTGELTSKAQFDYERKTNYTLLIRADNANNVSDFNERNLTIHIRNVNESPVFGVQTIRKHFLEKQVSGSKLVKLNATDPEGDAITYSLELSKELAGTFAIDGTTGWITATKTLELSDGNNRYIYRFGAVATENGTGDSRKSASVAIEIAMGGSAGTITGKVVTLIAAFLLIKLGL